MQIKKSKKQQAYEQAKAKYEQDIKIYRHNHDKIEDANEDDEAHDEELSSTMVHNLVSAELASKV